MLGKREFVLVLVDTVGAYVDPEPSRYLPAHDHRQPRGDRGYQALYLAELREYQGHALA
jgi:hypothetical protein